MIDAERMLGSLVRNAMAGGGKRRKKKRRRSRGGLLAGGSRAALGMGALGVAIAAFEHFSKQQPAGSQFTGGAPAPSPTPAASNLPPLPGSPPVSKTPLPPLPTTSGAAVEEASGVPGPAAGVDESTSAEALLLVRAMIAAANADHHLDEDERAQILSALDESGLSDEDRDYLLGEMESPVSLRTLAERADTPDLRRQVYLASLMAIEVDSDVERNYLKRLAAALRLDEAQVGELERLLGDSGAN